MLICNFFTPSWSVAILKCIPHALNALTTDLADAKSLFQLHLQPFKPVHVIANSFNVGRSDCSDWSCLYLFLVCSLIRQVLRALSIYEILGVSLL